VDSSSTGEREVEFHASPAKRFVFMRWQMIGGAAMAKRQRVFKGGTEYEVTGPSKRKRRLLFITTVKIEKREYLLLRPVRKVSKQVEA
jgi:hypothetical protein